MFTLKVAKGNFFDRKSIVRQMDNATRKGLQRGGALIRLIAKRSIREGGKSAKVSKPGEPPRSQTGLLKKFLVYVYVPGNFGKQSVWIGPALTNRSTGAPENLEFGATVRLAKGTPMRIKSGRNAKGRIQPDRIVAGPARTIRVEPRPYLGPALDKAVASGKLPEYWGGATIGGA